MAAITFQNRAVCVVSLASSSLARRRRHRRSHSRLRAPADPTSTPPPPSLTLTPRRPRRRLASRSTLAQVPCLRVSHPTALQEEWLHGSWVELHFGNNGNASVVPDSVSVYNGDVEEILLGVQHESGRSSPKTSLCDRPPRS